MAFDKKQYWKNRKEGKPGIPKPVTKKVLPNNDSDVEMGFDDNGKLVLKTRAWKRSHIKLRTKNLGVPPRKADKHKKNQEARKRREARELKKEKANANN